MAPAIPLTAKIAVLTSEMHTIHSANCLYWRQGEAVSLKERAKYQRRQDRLDQIRQELAQPRANRPA